MSLFALCAEKFVLAGEHLIELEQKATGACARNGTIPAAEQVTTAMELLLRSGDVEVGG